MTDQPTPGTTPGSSPSPNTASPTARPTDLESTQSHQVGPPTPPVEPAEAGSNAPAAAVARDGGASAAGTASPARPTLVRWAIAIGGVALVAVLTVAILSLTGARPEGSVGLGYMPADTVQYAEYRLDLPGDQRQKLAAFLSVFPGFADQSTVDTKITEVLDRLIGAISEGEQTYSRDIQPWFGGQISMASTVPGPAAAAQSGPIAAFGMGDSLVAISVTDGPKSIAWARALAGDGISESQHGGVTVYTVGAKGMPFAFAATGAVLLGGTERAVLAAIDTRGQGKLAEDAEFKAAFGTVERDYVAFSFVDVRGLIDGLLGMATGAAGIPDTTIDEELLSMLPAWAAGYSRFEDDALTSHSAYPSFRIGFDGRNERSTLSGHIPPGAILYAESHDVGPALRAVLERFRQMPELRATFAQADQVMALLGGFEGVFGWWGDVAFAISRQADGSLGGGLLIQPTDAAAAKRTFDTLRGFLALGGAQAGVQVRDEQHGDATVTIIDFSGASGLADLPPGVKPELAYTVTDEVVVIGYDAAWVKSVLDAGPGPSLADEPRFKDLVKRVGEENMGLTFVDVSAIRELMEPLARDSLPADGWAFYEREIKPYVIHLDAHVSGIRKDGDLDRLPQAFTVKR